MKSIIHNGEKIKANGDCFEVAMTRENIEPLVLDSTPAVMSIGYRCVEQGYGFIWKPYSKTPY
jgi:hypothetical protein